MVQAYAVTPARAAQAKERPADQQGARSLVLELLIDRGAGESLHCVNASSVLWIGGCVSQFTTRVRG